MAAKELTRDWIAYIKSKGIASKQSSPEGKLNYTRKVTTDDLSQFLQLNTQFSPDAIKKAIRTVIGSKKPGQPPAGALSTWQQNEINPAGPNNTKAVGANGPQQKRKFQKGDESDITDVTDKSTNNQPGKDEVINPETETARPKDFVPVTLNRIGAKPQVRLIHKSTVPEWEQSGWTAGDKSEGPATEPTDVPQQGNTSSNPQSPQQQPNKLKVKFVGRDQNGKPRYKSLEEDIKDVPAPDISEDEVEAVFNMLTNPPKKEQKPEAGSKYAFKNAKMPRNSGEDAKANEIDQIKTVIAKTMKPEQRKMLWDLLQPSSVTEAFANSDDVSKILTNISKLHSKTGNLDIEDLKRAWQKANRPDTTDKIKQLLNHLGYDDESIDKSINAAMGPQGNSENDEEPEDNRATEAITKIAEYIKQVGITNEIIEFLKDNFAEDLQPKPSMWQKAKNFGNKIFGRKATTEEIKHIFVNILKEDRKYLSEINRLIEASNLGRSRKK